MTFKELQDALPLRTTLNLNGRRGDYVLSYMDHYNDFSHMACGASIETLCIDLVAIIKHRLIITNAADVRPGDI